MHGGEFCPIAWEQIKGRYQTSALVVEAARIRLANAVLAGYRDGFLDPDLIKTRALNDLGPGDGKLLVENAGPVSVTLRADATGPLAHTTRITLFRDSRRIELHNEITQTFADVRSWGFGFNLDRPDVWHEEIGAVIRAKLLGDG